MKIALAVPAVLALVVAACSSTIEPEPVATDASPIIGGVAANTASMNAVGSLVNITRYSDPSAPGGERQYYGSPFCSAALIGPNAVLTAKHCVQNLSPTSEFGFAIGPDARSPVKVVPVVEFETESTVKGGVLNIGSDVAVLHLETAVAGIDPLAWSALDAADVGKRLVAVGYGLQNANGATGTRRAGGLTLRGTEGKVFELAFGSFDAFKRAVPNISDLRYEVGDVSTPEGEARARAIYDARVLLAGGYEALAGNVPGDAQICHGDSGGPLTRRVNGKSTIVGVSSWVQHSNIGYNFCDHVNVFATFGPATRTFITNALAWQDACEGLSVKGRCEGDTAVRCSAKSEGTRRALRTDCSELGLTCGTGSDRQVACVDPS